MANEASYVWKFDLSGQTADGDLASGYTAKVGAGSPVTLDDLAQAVCSERPDLQKEALVTAATLLTEKLKEFVCQGRTVVTGSATYQPVVRSTFLGTSGDPDNLKSKCEVAVEASQSLKNAVAKVKPEFTGNAKNEACAKISLVTDAYTGKTDGTITPGGGLSVVGSKIKCLNASGSGIGTISFIDSSTQEVAATVGTLISNQPSKVIFICPALKNGTYTLRIGTYYGSSSALLKSERVIDYPLTLTVSQMS